MRSMQEKTKMRADADFRPSRSPPGWPEREIPPAARPAGWLRFESGWLSSEQTLKNLETVVSLLQKTQEGLIGIDQLLEDAAAAVNECWMNGDKNQPPAEHLEPYVTLRLNQMDEIVRQCRFHGRGLLDGQSGVFGTGTGVEFIRGGCNTRSSPAGGYAVNVQELPSRASLTGGIGLDEDWVQAEEEIFLAEGERFVRYRFGPRESVDSLLEGLQEAVQTAGLDLQVGIGAQRRLIIRHNQFGSQYKFKGCSYKTPLLSKRPGKVEWSRKGRDIQGTLGGEPAFGIGRMLIGYLDNENTSELAVVWKGGRLEGERVGRCRVVQNGIVFQDGLEYGADPVRVSLPCLYTRYTGGWLDTFSGYESLAEVRFGNWNELRDSLHLIFAMSLELEDWKEKVASWIKRYQNQALACLRKGNPLYDPSSDEKGMTAGQAERMARQLKDLIHLQLAQAK